MQRNDNTLDTYLGHINKQVKKMTLMIDGFLNIARLEAGNVVLNKTSFLFSGLFLETIAEVQMISPAATIEFIDSEPVEMYADYEKIGQVVTNLLTNAIKYSPAGAPIKIFYIDTAEAVVAGVEDAGYGIAEEDHAKVFDRFYRADAAKNNTVSGFGVGLHLCAIVIHLHGGKIWVENSPGKGCTSYFNQSTGKK